MVKLSQIRLLTILTCGIATANLAFFTCPDAVANFTGWDFEDGTLQGWTLVSASTIGPTGYAATGRTDEPPLPETFWDPLGYNSKSPGFGFAAAPSPFPDRAAPQDAPLVLRSPTFELNSGGQIIAHLLGGIPQTQSVPPSNFSVLSGPSIDTAASTASGLDTSYQGLALRRNSDGEYLLHKARTSNSSSYTGWQQVTFSEAELAGVIASNPGQLFTLDLIDTAHGTFSSLNLDTVSIPTAANASLIQGGGSWAIRERLSATPVNSLADADALMALPPGIVDVDYTDYTANVVNIHDASPMSGHFGNDQLFVLGRDHFVATISGNINVQQSGDITFGFYSNAGGRLRIDGNLVAQDNFGDLACDTLGTINLNAGVHAFEFLYWENTGLETLEIYVATELGARTSIHQGGFELLQASNLTPPAGVPGDYNGNGKVDAADYILWRNGGPLQNQVHDPNNVTQEDYTEWRARFGNSSGSGSSLTTSVPEPDSTMLIVAVAVACMCVDLRGILQRRKQLDGRGCNT